MEEGLFPSARALELPDGLDEERRLCYVGITRAKDALILTWARARRRGGDLRPGIPSRFLRELPPELIDERRTSYAVSSIGGWGGARGWSGGRDHRAHVRAYSAPAPRDRVGEYSAPSTIDAGTESQDAPRYVKGERVRHRRFGSGAILGLSGLGKELKVSVAFDDPEIGTRQLLVALAGLERDWESA
jgi:DNA helicase-2/ATP-dependent DNA helicase PcrA